MSASGAATPRRVGLRPGIVLLAALTACTVHPVGGGATAEPRSTSSAASSTAAPMGALPEGVETDQRSPDVVRLAASSRWRPTVGMTWQWQLSGKLDRSVDVDVYDVDMFETSAATVRALHAKGRAVICYINVGSWENFRPDAGKFPRSVKGSSNGWPGERWLDIRQRDILRPLMKQRMKKCAKKGFDGVEPDLMDAFSNATGFPITAADQLRYNRMIARIAHSLGLAVGLKGDPEQAARLVKHFDFAINEQCVEYDECDLLSVFIAAGKPVFHVEYTLSLREFCPVTKKLKFSSMRKRLNLGAWRKPCP